MATAVWGVYAGLFSLSAQRASCRFLASAIFKCGCGTDLSTFTEVGVASLGLLLAFYFFIDAYASFAMGQQFKEHGVGGWGMINGILSLVLGILVLTTWPNSSPLLVGIFVGITLFFDGVMLLFLGKNISKGL